MTTTRRQGLAIGLILVVALALRVAWVVCVHPDPLAEGRFDDTSWYWASAHYFANGDGYVNPFIGTPTAAWPPGYPVFLGSVFWLFGEGVYQVAAANIALSLGTIVVVYFIARRLFNPATGLVAAAILAVWPGQIYFTSLALSEPLFTFLFALGVLLLLNVSAATSRRWLALVAFAAVVAFATLTRGQALLLVPLGMIVWVISNGSWRSAIGWGMLATVIVAAMLAPWVIRNEIKLGSPVIIATNMGPNVWIGHHDGATGGMHVRGGALPQPDHSGLTQQQIEVQADTIALKKGLAYMLSHPREELRLSALKLRIMYGSDREALGWNSGFERGHYGSAGIERALAAAADRFWFAALILAGVGFLSLLRSLRHPAILLPMLVLTWTATHLLFFGDPRFHYPIAFVIAILAARGSLVVLELALRPLPGRRRKGYATA